MTDHPVPLWNPEPRSPQRHAPPNLLIRSLHFYLPPSCFHSLNKHGLEPPPNLLGRASRGPFQNIPGHAPAQELSVAPRCLEKCNRPAIQSPLVST